MDPNCRLQLVASNDVPRLGAAAGTSLSVEFGRRGVFVSVGGFDVYLCLEPESAWTFQRDPAGFEVQIWRLHLMVGRNPA